MKPPPPLVLALRTKLLRGVALLIVGGASAAASYRLAADAAGLRTREAERQVALADDIRVATREAAQIGQGDSRFREMTRRGAVGTERRTDWLRYLSQLRERFPTLEFELGPQQVAGIEALPRRIGQYEFAASSMKLKVDVLHEPELLDLLDDMRRSVSAVLHVRACRIRRIAETSATSAARLSAECSIDWITLQGPSS